MGGTQCFGSVCQASAVLPTTGAEGGSQASELPVETADKHSGVLLRTPFLANVLKQVRCKQIQPVHNFSLCACISWATARFSWPGLDSLVTAQPFYSTEHVTELVRDAEQRIEELRQGEETGK